jgi:hypothetical protein
MSSRRLSLLSALACATALIQGCASFTHEATLDSRPGPERGIIYGRMRVERDGVMLGNTPYKPLYVNVSVDAHISPYEGVDKLHRNEWGAGKWLLLAPVNSDTEGYFSLELPVGRYYIVYFLYDDIVGRDVIYSRTYETIEGATITKPWVMTFDVLPGKANYVGTWMHRFFTKDRYPNPASAYSDIELIDEGDEAFQWLSRKLPNLVPFSAPGVAIRTDLN